MEKNLSKSLINSPLVKISEAAKILGVSIDTLRRWERKGKIQPLKTPGQTRLYPLDELTKFNSYQPSNNSADTNNNSIWTIGTGHFQNLCKSGLQPQKISVTSIFLALFMLISIAVISGTITFSYLSNPQLPKHFFANQKVLGVKTEKASIFATLLSPFNDLSQAIIQTFNPQKAKELGFEKLPVKKQDEKQTLDIKTLENKVANLASAITTLESSPGTYPGNITYIDLIGKTIIDSFGNIYPANSGLAQTIKPSLGTPSNRFYGLYLHNFSVDTAGSLTASGDINVSGNTTLGSTSSNTVKIIGRLNNDLIPSGNGSQSLGDGDHYWKNGYINTITADLGGATSWSVGTLTVSSGTSFASSLLPLTTATYDIGSSSKYWRDLYLSNRLGIGSTVPAANLYVDGNAMIGYSSGGPGSLTNGLAVSGNLGIGTTSPANKLQVIGGGVIGGSYGSYSAPSNGLLVQGNVGIGATTSSNLLDVWGNSRITGTLTVDSTGTLSSGLIGYSGVTAPTSGLAISGNVGIGTTSPLAPLQIWGNNTNSAFFLNGNVGIGTTIPQALFQVNSTSSNPVVITSSGILGIGTTAPLPGLKLDVSGSARIANQLQTQYICDEKGSNCKDIRATRWSRLSGDGNVSSFVKIASDTNGGPTLADSDIFGNSVSAIGDLNGDGVEDLAVGARTDDTGGTNRGATYILFMNTNGTVSSSVKIASGTNGGPTLTGGDYFGASVSSIGDLNGDGVEDLAVGAILDDTGGTNRGATYILFMNTNGTVSSSVKIASGTNGGPTLTGGDYFGASVSSIGDLNGDGVEDLAVGAYLDGTGGNYYGATYILFMNTNGTVSSSVKIASGTNGGPTLTGGDYFGASVSSIGDLNGDGVEDLAVGAILDDTGGTNRGATYILFMNTNGTVSSSVKIASGTNGGPTLTDSDFFGNSVSSIGDLNGDGVEDLTVGAYGDDTGGAGRGAAYILFMNTNGTVNSSVKIASGTNGGPTLADNDMFSSSVTSMGDLNGDGVEDIAVGARQDDTGGTNRGAFYILFMAKNNIYFSGQNVGIGVTTPGSMLSIAGNGVFGFGGATSIVGPTNGLGISGNLGVGTTSPNNKLQVIGAGVFGSDYGQYSAPSNGLLVQGNVGIGSTGAVGYGLDVWGTGRISSAFTVGGNIGVGASVNTSSAGIFGSLGTSSLAVSGNTTLNTLTASGNVGIGASASITGLTYALGGLRVNGYSDLTGNVGIGGTASFASSIYSQGSFYGINGSATAPAYSFTNLTNAGVWTNGDGLLLTTSGSATSGLAITAGGNIGVGTTSPSQLFQINSNTSNPVVITSGGNIGIGTTSPQDAVHVSGTGLTQIRISSTNSSNVSSKFLLYNDINALGQVSLVGSTASGSNLALLPSSLNLTTTGTGGLALITTSANAPMIFATGGTGLSNERMRINSSGNVGIGTTAPAQLFQVSTGLAFDSANNRLGIGTTTPLSTLSVIGGGVFGNDYAQYSAPANGLLVQGNVGLGSTGAVGYGLDVWGTGRITSALTVGGNIGIGGTATFNSLVSVSGNIIPSANNTYDLGSDSSRWRDLYLGPNTLHLGTSISDEYTLSYDTSNNSLGFNINGSGPSEITFDSLGNVGIGTSVPHAKLSIQGNVGIGYTGVNQAIPVNGLAVFGNVGIGTTTSNSTLSVSGSAHIGSLRQGISAPTNGLFVDGNVGIGATTSSNILDIWGNSRISGTLAVDSTGTLGSGLIGYSGVTAPTSGLAIAGNLGIGTTSPLAPLQIWGNGTNSSFFLNGNVGIGTTIPQALFQVNSTSSNPVVITSSGILGIGTTAPLPGLKLDVSGSARVTNQLQTQYICDEKGSNCKDIRATRWSRLSGDGNVSSSVKIASDTNGGPTLADSDTLGRGAIASIGDLNGDGIEDIAVGATGDDTGGSGRGALYIFFMNTNGTVSSSVKIASGTNGGPTLADGDSFGQTVTSIGDLNGDGIEDIAVGAVADDTGGSGRGAAYILFMNTDGTVASSVKIASGTNGGPTLADSDLFGRSIANIGDINGDGVEDLAVGASGDDTGGTGRGAAYILFMNTNGTVSSSVKIASGTNGGPTLVDNDGFGFAATSIGDLDHNGVKDIAIGADSDDTGGSGRGAFYVLFMNTDGTVASNVKIASGTNGGPTISTDNSFFGAALSSIGDMNGDGIEDIAAGEYFNDTGGTNRGAIHILFMNINGTVASNVKIASGTNGGPTLADSDSFGRAVTSIGDLNGDGVVDLAVGAYGDDTGGDTRGAVYILFLARNNLYFSGQNVGIGVTTPGSSLSVSGNGIFGFGGATSIVGPTNGLGISGNLGIGTTSPNNKLQVIGGGVFGTDYGQYSAPTNGLLVQGNVGLGSTGAVNYGLDVWGTGRVTGALTVGGNVGIGGTATFNSLVSVSGNIIPSANNTYDLGSDSSRWRDLYLGPNTLHLGTSISDEYTLSYDTSNNSLGFNINGSGPSEITFDSLGNVGIGTSVPHAKLSIQGNVGIGYTGVNQAIPVNGLAVFGNVGIGTTTSNSTLSVSGSAHIGSLRQGISAPTNGLFVDGNVGIGATTSSNILDIWGNSRISGTLAVDGAGTLGSGLIGYSGVTAPTSGLAIAGNLGIGTTSPLAPLQIWGNNTTSALFLNGNVGIGFSSPSAKLEVDGDVFLRGTGSNLQIENNNALQWNQAGSSTFWDVIKIQSDNSLAIRGINNQPTHIVAGSMAPVVTFLNDGNTGIGTTSPIAKLGVAGNVGIGMSYGWYSAPANGMIVEGNVGIGASTPNYNLDIWGTTRSTSLSGTGNRAVYSDADGQLTNSASDIRLKTNIQTISDRIDVLGALDKLRGVYFNWNIDIEGARHFGAKEELGMIAQEVEAVLPDLVGMNADGYKSLNYAQMTGFLVEVGKAQQLEISSLKSQMLDLQNKQASSSAQTSDVLGLNTVLEGTPSASINTFSSVKILEDLDTDSLTTIDATISGTLKALGDTFLGNTIIAGNLTVDGTTSITGDSISTIGTLNLQNGPLAEAVDFFNGKVTIDKTGKITAETVKAKSIHTEKLIIENSTSPEVGSDSSGVRAASLGSGIIKAGETSIIINTTSVTKDSRIFITPTTTTDKTLAAVDIKEEQSFKVTIASPVPSDLTFNWWIVESK